MRSCNHCCSEKAVSITYSECVCVCVCVSVCLSVCLCILRYPACNAHAPYCRAVACLAVQYFSTLSNKRYDFLNKKKLLNIKCVFLHNFYMKHFSMYICLHVKYQQSLSHSNETWIIWTDFRKMLKYQISLKKIHIQLESSCFMRTDRWIDEQRTDRHDEANSHFSQFSERAYIFSLPKLATVLYCEPRVAVMGKPVHGPHNTIIWTSLVIINL